MEERTLKIISVCKGKSKIPKKSQQYDSILDSVVDYMSDECDCPIEYYDSESMLHIMQEASYDYLRTCDYPHTFLRSYFKALEDAENFKFLRGEILRITNEYGAEEMAEALCNALAQVQVMDDGKYINGFHENDLKPVYPYKED